MNTQSTPLINWHDRAKNKPFGQFLLEKIQHEARINQLNTVDENAVRSTLYKASDIWHEAHGRPVNFNVIAGAIDEMVEETVKVSSQTVYQVPHYGAAPGKARQLTASLKDTALRIHNGYGLSVWDYVIGGLYAYDIGTNFLGMAYMFEGGSVEDTNALLRLVAYGIMVILAILVSLMEHAISRGFNTFIWLITYKEKTDEIKLAPGTRWWTIGATVLVVLIGILIMFWGYSTSASVFPRFMGDNETTLRMGWLVAFFISALQWMHVVTRRFHIANLINA